MAKVLIVEDEKDLAALIAQWLFKKDRHLVEILHNGDEALIQMHASKFDVILLDIMLPGKSGIDVCKQYRATGGQTPIMMLTAKAHVNDKELALDAGADDYLTKPFELKELAARVRALLRRGDSKLSNVIHLRDITIHTQEHKITKNGKNVHLLPKEFRLLEFLARHPNRVFSAEQLLSSVWESDTQAHVDTVRGHITRLRRKLDTDGSPSIISTVYGLGYKIGDV